MRALALLAAPLVACSGGSYNYDGQNLSQYFPLDGDRQWEYRQCAAADTGDLVDTEVYAFYDLTGCSEPTGGVLKVEKFPETSVDGSTEKVTLNTSWDAPDGTNTLLHSIVWSSDDSRGVRIYSYQDLQTGEETIFDKAVIFADYQMNVGDTVETSTNGVTFRATYVETLGNCPNNWNGGFEECARIKVEAEGSDAPFLGDWWIGATYGTNAVQFAGESDVWVLDDAVWNPTSD